VLLTEDLILGKEHHNLPAWYMPNPPLINTIQARFNIIFPTCRPSIIRFNQLSGIQFVFKHHVAFTQSEVISAPMEKIFETFLFMQATRKPDGKEKQDALLKLGRGIRV